MGKTFVDNTNGISLVIATLLTLIYGFIICKVFFLPYILLGIIPVLMILGYIFAKLMTRKIGGVTGDTLGAVVEISEILVIFMIYLCASLFV